MVVRLQELGVRMNDEANDPDEEEEEEEDDGPPIVVGTLMKNRTDQISLDLVFDRPFSISHTGSGSIYLAGYKSMDEDEEFGERMLWPEMIHSFGFFLFHPRNSNSRQPE